MTKALKSKAGSTSLKNGLRNLRFMRASRHFNRLWPNLVAINLGH